jgi:hypothetical protein
MSDRTDSFSSLSTPSREPPPRWEVAYPNSSTERSASLASSSKSSRPDLAMVLVVGCRSGSKPRMSQKFHVLRT